MGSRVHVDGKEKAGSHTSITEATNDVWEVLKKAGAQRISPAYIQGNAKAKTRSVKIKDDGGALKLTVVSPGTKQEVYVYGIKFDVALVALKRELRGSFFVNT